MVNKKGVGGWGIYGCVDSIDDIEDNSNLRRGVPVAHNVYGVPATINCANLVYFEALRRTHVLQNEEATCAFVGESLLPYTSTTYVHFDLFFVLFGSAVLWWWT